MHVPIEGDRIDCITFPLDSLEQIVCSMVRTQVREENVRFQKGLPLECHHQEPATDFLAASKPRLHLPVEEASLNKAHLYGVPGLRVRSLKVLELLTLWYVRQFDAPLVATRGAAPATIVRNIMRALDMNDAPPAVPLVPVLRQEGHSATEMPVE